MSVQSYIRLDTLTPKLSMRTFLNLLFTTTPRDTQRWLQLYGMGPGSAKMGI